MDERWRDLKLIVTEPKADAELTKRHRSGRNTAGECDFQPAAQVSHISGPRTGTSICDGWDSFPVS
jgi:hypothetical protein